MISSASRLPCCSSLLSDLPNIRKLIPLSHSFSLRVIILNCYHYPALRARCQTPTTWTGDWIGKWLTGRPQAVQPEPPTTSACRGPPSAPRCPRLWRYATAPRHCDASERRYEEGKTTPAPVCSHIETFGWQAFTFTFNPKVLPPPSLNCPGAHATGL